jgi:hypothetical protein
MKHLIFFLIGLFITTISIAQKQDTYFAGKLISECPSVIDSIKDVLDFENYKYISIETGVDSLEVLFGEITQGVHKGYWACQIINDKLKSFGTISLEENKANGSLTGIKGIIYDSSYDLISLKIEYNPSTEEVYYTWLKNYIGSNTIPKPTIIEEREQKNLDFPTFPTK